MYEIAIGALSNSKTIIRRSNQGATQAQSATSEIVDGDTFTDFWADAKNGLIRFGRGSNVGENLVLQWQDPNPRDVGYVGFMTGWGATGKWKVCFVPPQPEFECDWVNRCTDCRFSGSEDFAGTFSSLAECKLACEDSNSCLGINYRSNGVCYLNQEATETENDEGYDAYVKTCDPWLYELEGCSDIVPPSHWNNPTCALQLENTDNCDNRRNQYPNDDGYCHVTCGLCRELALPKFAVGTCEPSGTYELDECCPTGYNEAVNAELCVEAMSALTMEESGVFYGSEDAQTNKPSGCYWDTTANTLNFNPSDMVGSTVEGNDKVVCVRSEGWRVEYGHHTKCIDDTNGDRMVMSFELCKTYAAEVGAEYIAYTTQNDGYCVVVDTCDSPISGTIWDWKVYRYHDYEAPDESEDDTAEETEDEAPAVCVSTDTLDMFGMDCSSYAGLPPGMCGTFDDDDFVANDMCCECGGNGVGGGSGEADGGIQINCKFTIDNVVSHVLYNGEPITVTGGLDNWTSVKEFSFTSVSGAYLEIGGHETATCDGCSCAGLLLECDNGLTSNTDDWEAVGSTSANISPTNGFGDVCVSSSGFSLIGQTSDAQKIWPHGGQTYAWFRTIPVGGCVWTEYGSGYLSGNQKSEWDAITYNSQTGITNTLKECQDFCEQDADCVAIDYREEMSYCNMRMCGPDTCSVNPSSNWKVYTCVGAESDSGAQCVSPTNLNTFTTQADMEANGWSFADGFSFKPSQGYSDWIDNDTELWGGQENGGAGSMEMEITLTGSGTISIEYGCNWSGVSSIELNGVEKDVVQGVSQGVETMRTVTFDFVDGDVLKLVAGGDGNPAILVLRSITINCASDGVTFLKMNDGQQCSHGRISKEETCMTAALYIGKTYSRAWHGAQDPGCIHANDGRNQVFFNSNLDAANTMQSNYAEICLMSDDFCINGVLGTASDGMTQICCPSDCGTCGGAGCSQRPGGASQCCTTFIQDSGVLCASSGVTACIMPPKYDDDVCYLDETYSTSVNLACLNDEPTQDVKGSWYRIYSDWDTTSCEDAQSGSGDGCEGEWSAIGNADQSCMGNTERITQYTDKSQAECESLCLNHPQCNFISYFSSTPTYCRLMHACSDLQDATITPVTTYQVVKSGCASSCDSSSWSDVKEACLEQPCAALVYSSAYGGICEEFCVAQGQGLHCVDVKEDQSDNCVDINEGESAQMSCFTDVRQFGSGSDYICFCGGSGDDSSNAQSSCPTSVFGFNDIPMDCWCSGGPEFLNSGEVKFKCLHCNNDGERCDECHDGFEVDGEGQCTESATITCRERCNRQGEFFNSIVSPELGDGELAECIRKPYDPHRGGTLVFRQTWDYYWTPGELSKNVNNPMNDNYAILDQLESLRAPNGRFYFRLVWPGDDTYYEWTQTSNPVSSPVEGYIGFHIPYTGQQWGGLGPGHDANCLIDGTLGHGWYYALGAYKKWGHFNGYPSYAKTDQERWFPQKQVELYVYEEGYSGCKDFASSAEEATALLTSQHCLSQKAGGWKPDDFCGTYDKEMCSDPAIGAAYTECCPTFCETEACRNVEICRPCTSDDDGCTHPGNADAAWCKERCTSGENDPWECPRSHCICDTGLHIARDLFTIEGDGCEQNGNCIQTENYEMHYENNAQCTVHILQNLIVSSIGERWSVETCCDDLMIDGVDVHGKHQLPESFFIGIPFSWSTDGSGQRRGWQICFLPTSDSNTCQKKNWSVDGRCGLDFGGSVCMQEDPFCNQHSHCGQESAGRHSYDFPSYCTDYFDEDSDDAGLFYVSENDDGDCFIKHNCVQSRGYPETHGHNEQCKITLLKTSRLLLGSTFGIEFPHDDLIINDVTKVEHPTDIPGVLAKGDTILWDSDHSVAEAGWQICFIEEPHSCHDISPYNEPANYCTEELGDRTKCENRRSNVNYDGYCARTCGVCRDAPLEYENFDSPEDMRLAGWSVSHPWEPTMFIWPGTSDWDSYCSTVPTSSYCGFYKPVDGSDYGSVFYTFTRSGYCTYSFSEVNTDVVTTASKNEEQLNVLTGPGTIIYDIYVNAGDVLSFTTDSGIINIRSFAFDPAVCENDYNAYCNSYPDLFNDYCDDICDDANENQACQQHYEKYGEFEIYVAEIREVPDCHGGNCNAEWSDWSECGATCNSGIQYRTYSIHQQGYGGGSLCDFDDKDVQQRYCNTEACPGCVLGDTANAASYNEVVPGELGMTKAVIFTVKAASDARIGFLDGQLGTETMYEIVLGGEQNTQSSIRRAHDGENLYTITTPNILSAEEKRAFWASARGGHVRVGYGEEIGEQLLMDWFDSIVMDDPTDFEPIKVGMTSGTNADWHFCLYQDEDTWTTCYTSDDGVSIDSEFTSLTNDPRQVGYRRDCRSKSFNQIRYVNIETGEAACFKRSSGSTSFVNDVSENDMVLWEAFEEGVADPEWDYQLIMCADGGREVGLMISGKRTSWCWKTCGGNWCGDRETPYFRMNGDIHNQKIGVAFNENGYDAVSHKAMSVSIRQSAQTNCNSVDLARPPSSCRPCVVDDPGCTNPGDADEDECLVRCIAGVNDPLHCPVSHCTCEDLNVCGVIPFPDEANWVRDRVHTDGAHHTSMVAEEYEFTTHGEVSQWTFWANRDQGWIARVLQIVENAPDDHTYRILCENVIPPMGRGERTFVVPAEDRCIVNPGDVIGWYHESNGVFGFTNGGTQKVRWRLMGSNAKGSKNDMIRFNGNGNRMYSIQATVCPRTWSIFHNFCVSSQHNDLVQTNWFAGDATREACRAECLNVGQACTAFEWYDSGWDRSKCKLILADTPATHGSTGDRWHDAECHVKPQLNSFIWPSGVILRVYRDHGSCGPDGNDANQEMCGYERATCPEQMPYFACQYGRAERTKFEENYMADDCFFHYYAEYECMDEFDIPDIGLVAYWDYGDCGPEGGDANWGVCQNQHGNCPEIIDTDECLQGVARLSMFVRYVKLNGCNYVWYAEYECMTSAWAFVAWQSEDDCDAISTEEIQYENARSDSFCEGGPDSCPDLYKVEKEVCLSTFAQKYSVKTNTNIEGCSYDWVVYFLCTPDPGTVVEFAYWEWGNCGVKGDDWNWDICKRNLRMCPHIIPSQKCPYNQAEKITYISDTSIDDCYYIYYVEYACTTEENPCFEEREEQYCGYTQDLHIGDGGEHYDVKTVQECSEKCLGDEYCVAFNYVHSGTDSGGPDEEGTGACYYRSHIPTKIEADPDRTCFTRRQKCGGVLSQAAFCSCWGDPHCVTFEDSFKKPPPMSFHHQQPGDFTLFEIETADYGDWKIIQTQKSMGRVAIIERLRVFHNDVVLFDLSESGNTPVLTFVEDKISKVDMDRHMSSQQWPSNMTPGSFKEKWSFEDFPNLHMLISQRIWRGQMYINVGLQYFGDYTQSNGFCHTRTEAEKEAIGLDLEPEPPVQCRRLENCCQQFFQSHAQYEGCMIDAQPDCCPEGLGAIVSPSCCKEFVDTCPDDIECSDGFVCNEEIGLCEEYVHKESPLLIDCIGSWTLYGACSASCGTGRKTRTYAVTTEAEGGKDCPFENGETYSTTCNAGYCPSTNFCEDWPRNFYDGENQVIATCDWWEQHEEGDTMQCRHGNMLVCAYCGECVDPREGYNDMNCYLDDTYTDYVHERCIKDPPTDVQIGTWEKMKSSWNQNAACGPDTTCQWRCKNNGQAFYSDYGPEEGPGDTVPCFRKKITDNDCVGDWSDWGYCSKSDGEGTWTRYRKSLEDCETEFSEVEECNIREC